MWLLIWMALGLLITIFFELFRKRFVDLSNTFNETYMNKFLDTQRNDYFSASLRLCGFNKHMK